MAPDKLDEHFLDTFKERCEQYPNFGHPDMTARAWWKGLVLDTFLRSGMSYEDLMLVYGKACRDQYMCSMFTSLTGVQ